MEDRVRRGSVAGEHPAGEWARSETSDLADAARQRMAEAKGEAREYAAEAKEYVQEAVEQTKDYVEGAREYIGDAVQQARDKMTIIARAAWTRCGTTSWATPESNR